MQTISSAEMQAMDRYAIEKIGIPSIVLMESAALKVVEQINREELASFTVVCATGNNGGDGLAIARRLLLANKKVDIFIIGDPLAGTADFQTNFEILKNMHTQLTVINKGVSLDVLQHSLAVNQLTIDAIFGIGLDREVEGIYAQVISQMNQFSQQMLAVDVPSGIDGDTGEVLGRAVKAQQTISFHRMKKGLPKNSEYSGEIIVADIGIPDFVTDLILKNSAQHA